MYYITDCMRTQAYELNLRKLLAKLDDIDCEVELIADNYGQSGYLSINFGGFYFKIDTFMKFKTQSYWMGDEFFKDICEAIMQLRETEDYKLAVGIFNLKTLITRNDG